MSRQLVPILTAGGLLLVAAAAAPAAASAAALSLDPGCVVMPSCAEDVSQLTDPITDRPSSQPREGCDDGAKRSGGGGGSSRLTV